jgi:hypothetical protein
MTTLQELWDSCDQRPLPVTHGGRVYKVFGRATIHTDTFLCENGSGTATRLAEKAEVELDLPKPKLVPHFQAIFKGAGEGPYSTSRDLYSSEEQARLSLGIDFVRLDDRAVLLPEKP